MCETNFRIYRISGIQILYRWAQQNAAMRTMTHFKIFQIEFFFSKNILSKIELINSSFALDHFHIYVAFTTRSIDGSNVDVSLICGNHVQFTHIRLGQSSDSSNRPSSLKLDSLLQEVCVVIKQCLELCET